jgi:hypothetical protein
VSKALASELGFDSYSIRLLNEVFHENKYVLALILNKVSLNRFN